MGGEEDPKDGGAVAGAVFGAVFIYIVCGNESSQHTDSTNGSTGFLCLLRTTSLPSHAREPSRRDKPVMILRGNLSATKK